MGNSIEIPKYIHPEEDIEVMELKAIKENDSDFKR